MGLREKIMQSVQKIFGRKVLTSVSEVEEVEKEGGQLTQTAVSEFEKNIKVENTPTLDGKLFSQITSEARNSVLMNLQAFRNTVLSSDEFKKLQGKDARPGMADKVPFVCVAEMDDDGKIKTTIIAIFCNNVLGSNIVNSSPVIASPIINTIPMIPTINS